MTANESLKLDYIVFSSSDSSSVLVHDDGHNKISTIIAPFLFTFLSMTIQTNDISMVSQPVTVCQTIDISEPISKEEILRQFVSKLVLESKDIDPEIAEIVNKNYRDLLW